MELPDWLRKKQAFAQEAYQNASSPNLKYGLTIRLSTKGFDLGGRGDDDSEQVVTLDYENCTPLNLFENLDNPLVKKYLLSTQLEETTVFEHFAKGYADIGLVIHIEKGQQAMVNLTRTLTSKTYKEYILVIAEENSTLTFTDTYQNMSEVKTSVVEVIAKDNSQIKYATLQSGKGNDLSSYRGKLHTSAKLDWCIAALSNNFSRNIIHSELVGEGSEVNSYGMFLGNESEQFDISAATFHKANKSLSDMYFRGVLIGNTKGVFRGLLDIDAQAFGCNGYQTEETILVGKNAVADAIPNLQIRNNDVKCSHGATIGRVDDEQLFYLKARGIGEEEAVKMIVEGFFEPVVAKLHWPELFEKIQPLVQQKLGDA